MTDHEERTLDLDDDPAFLRHERRLTRLGWIVLGLFVLAGILGLLGPGLFSSTTAGSAQDAVRVQHDRVAHLESETRLTLLLDGAAARDGTVTVELTGSWITGVDVQSVNPQPDAQKLVPGGTAYQFTVERSGPAEITLGYRPQELGRLALTAEAGGSTVTTHQLVLP